MAVYKPTHRFTGANARSMEYELRKISETIADIPIGDITGAGHQRIVCCYWVTAGTNLNGGGTSGTVTLNLDTNITGDITFDTNVLAVDTTNDRVGIGTTSPCCSVAGQYHRI